MKKNPLHFYFDQAGYVLEDMARFIAHVAIYGGAADQQDYAKELTERLEAAQSEGRKEAA